MLSWASSRPRRSKAGHDGIGVTSSRATDARGVSHLSSALQPTDRVPGEVEIFYRKTLGAKRSCTLCRGRRLDRPDTGQVIETRPVLHDAKEPHPNQLPPHVQ